MKKSLFILLVIPMFIVMMVFGLIVAISERYDDMCSAFEDWCWDD